MPLESLFVFPVEPLLHRFKFRESKCSKRLAGLDGQIEELFKTLNLTDPKSFDAAFGL